MPRTPADYKGDECSGWYADDGAHCEPTHWMPLPSAPRATDCPVCGKVECAGNHSAGSVVA